MDFDFSSSNAISAEEIRQRLLHIQSQSGLTQAQLAKYLKIGQPAVSKYLRGRIPPADVLYKMARLGKTTMEWILHGEKSYFYASGATIREPAVSYDALPDADIRLARRIARLPAEARQVLRQLIDLLEA